MFRRAGVVHLPQRTGAGLGRGQLRLPACLAAQRQRSACPARLAQRVVLGRAGRRGGAGWEGGYRARRAAHRAAGDDGEGGAQPPQRRVLGGSLGGTDPRKPVEHAC